LLVWLQREEHPCDLVCGRKLPCGLHKCTEPCHKNNCPPCLMAGKFTLVFIWNSGSFIIWRLSEEEKKNFDQLMHVSDNKCMFQTCFCYKFSKVLQYPLILSCTVQHKYNVRAGKISFWHMATGSIVCIAHVVPQPVWKSGNFQ
jgi:hypothetical protein